MLETSTAQELWEDANRTAHEQLIAVLEDKRDAVSTEEGTVNLNLGSLLTNLADQVGFGADLAEKLPPDAAQIEILRSDQLKTAQNIAVAIKGLALVLSILTFLVFGAADLPLARRPLGDGPLQRHRPDRRRLRGDRRPRHRRRDRRRPAGRCESAKPAGEAAWSIATSLMTSIATTVIVIGVLFAIAGWLASPTGSARATRRVIAPVLQDHVPYVYTGLAIIVCLYFLSGRPRACAPS